MSHRKLIYSAYVRDERSSGGPVKFYSDYTYKYHDWDKGRFSYWSVADDGKVLVKHPDVYEPKWLELSIENEIENEFIKNAKIVDDLIKMDEVVEQILSGESDD